MFCLLDTNILIYMLNKDISVISFLEKSNFDGYAVSIVNWMEVMVGAKKRGQFFEAKNLFQVFKILPLDLDIAEKVVNVLEKEARSLRFPQSQDIIIAQTAINYNIPLVTANVKDFCRFKGLQIIPVKIKN